MKNSWDFHNSFCAIWDLKCRERTQCFALFSFFSPSSSLLISDSGCDNWTWSLNSYELNGIFIFCVPITPLTKWSCFFLWWLVWITMIYMKFYKKKGVMKGVKRICQLVLYKITRDDIDYIFFLAVIMTI